MDDSEFIFSIDEPTVFCPFAAQAANLEITEFVMAASYIE
jgi:hypothetical protein